MVTGDGRPQAHGRSHRGEGADEGAAERTGPADFHRALAGAGPVSGNPPPSQDQTILVGWRTQLPGPASKLSFFSVMFLREGLEFAF